MRINKTLLGLTSTALLSILSTLNVQAAVIYDNGPAVPYANRSDLDNNLIRADLFTLSSAATVQSVSWSGIYTTNNTPTGPDNFTINFYADSGGSVGSLLPSGSNNVGNAVNRVDSGTGIGTSFDIYNYAANITPLGLTAGSYWISIHNNTPTDTNDDWSWLNTCVPVTGPCQNAAATSSNGASWTTGGNDLDFVFTLHDTQVAPVPVPAAVWLMGSALMGLVGFRRKNSA